jgi:hypothetical protein
MLQSALDFVLAYQYFLVATAALMAVLQVVKRLPAVKEWFREEAWFREYVMPWIPMLVVGLLGAVVPGLRPEGMSVGVGAITGVLFGAFASAIYKGFKTLFRGMYKAVKSRTG